MDEPVFWLSVLIMTVGPTIALVFAYFAFKHQGNDHRSTFETRRLFFASGVLLGIGFIFVEGMILHYYTTSANGKGTEIFETCKTVLPPIVTLILGYYFGTTSTRNDEAPKSPVNADDTA